MAAPKAKLGEILVRAGVVDPDQLRAALGEQKRWGRRLGQTLINMGALSEKDLVRALASQLKLPVVQLDGKQIEPEILALIPLELAEKHGCLPLFIKEGGGVRTLYLGMEDPSDVEALDDARFSSGLPVVPVMVSHSDLVHAISRSYPGASPPPPREIPAQPQERMGNEPISARTALREPPSVSAVEFERRIASSEAAPRREPAGAGAEGGLAEIQKVSSTEMLKALTQVLIQKGLVTSEELADCIRWLRSQDTPES